LVTFTLRWLRLVGYVTVGLRLRLRSHVGLVAVGWLRYVCCGLLCYVCCCFAFAVGLFGLRYVWLQLRCHTRTHTLHAFYTVTVGCYTRLLLRLVVYGWLLRLRLLFVTTFGWLVGWLLRLVTRCVYAVVTRLRLVVTLVTLHFVWLFTVAFGCGWFTFTVVTLRLRLLFTAVHVYVWLHTFTFTVAFGWLVVYVYLVVGCVCLVTFVTLRLRVWLVAFTVVTHVGYTHVYTPVTHTVVYLRWLHIWLVVTVVGCVVAFAHVYVLVGLGCAFWFTFYVLRLVVALVGLVTLVGWLVVVWLVGCCWLLHARWLLPGYGWVTRLVGYAVVLVVHIVGWLRWLVTLVTVALLHVGYGYTHVRLRFGCCCLRLPFTRSFAVGYVGYVYVTHAFTVAVAVTFGYVWLRVYVRLLPLRLLRLRLRCLPTRVTFVVRLVWLFCCYVTFTRVTFGFVVRLRCCCVCCCLLRLRLRCVWVVAVLRYTVYVVCVYVFVYVLRFGWFTVTFVGLRLRVGLGWLVGLVVVYILFTL